MPKMPSCHGTPSGTIHAMTPVAIAAAPTQMRKNPGATISAAASNMPIDSQIQCGSILASQSGMSGSRLALDRVARELADPAQSADPLGRLDRKQARLAVRACRELDYPPHTFLAREIF